MPPFVEGSDDFFLNDERNQFHDHVAAQIRAGLRPLTFAQFTGRTSLQSQQPALQGGIGSGASSLNLGALLGFDDSEGEKLGPLFQALLQLQGQRGNDQDGMFSLFSGIQL